MFQAPWCIRTDSGYASNSILLPADGRGFGLFPPATSLSRSPKHDFLCVRNIGFACASCLELVVCAGSQAYVESCDSSMRCVSQAPFPGGVCYPITPHHQQCVCRKKGQRLQDPYDPRAYLLCPSVGGDPKLIYCSEHHEFDPASESCIRPPDFPRCLSTGVFALPGNCYWYYTCLPNEVSGSWRQYHDHCVQETQVYSRVTGRCEDPATLPLGDPCSTQQVKRSKRFNCTFWQLLVVAFFPSQISTICTPI